MRPVKINVAEAIIEPFWDRQTCGIRKWDIKGIKPDAREEKWWDNIPDNLYSKDNVFYVKSDDSSGIWLKGIWSQLEFGCDEPNGSVLEMKRTFNIDCSNYDNLLLCALIPPNSSLILTAITDKGETYKRFETSEFTHKCEYALPIKASVLIAVKIEVIFSESEFVKGFFHWLMLRNSELEKVYVQSLTVTDDDWEPWLKDESYQPVFKPFLGITTDENTLEMLRKNKKLVQTFTDKAYEMKQPEHIISDYVNFGQDKRIARERDYEKYFEKVEDIAAAALLTKDTVLMRKAARYALSIASCSFWQDSFMCRSAGLLFDHKAFVESICCRVIATILDLAGEMFTNAGVQFLLRRLSEEGLANINWVVWKYSQFPENIFDINQLAWFSEGRLAAYVVVEKFWKRVETYTEIAYNELCESINQIILPDGGYDEGPGYFAAVASFAGRGLYWYAMSRGHSFSEVIPQNLKHADDFAECVLSIDESIPLIPVGDTHVGKEKSITFSILAALMPCSHWVTIFRRLWKKDGEECTDFLTLSLEKSIPQKYSAYRSYISMPDLGAVSSLRDIEGEKIKIFQCGGNAGANHAHNDKGSFVVQFAGETVFADPGTGSYDDYIGSSMGRIEWHNMLIPQKNHRIIDPAPPIKDIKPISKGDNVSFYSKMDLLPCWQGVYFNWSRELISDQPDSLTVIDRYSLDNADSVLLNLVTPLNVNIEDNRVLIIGGKSKTVIEPDEGCKLKIKKLPYYKDKQYTRITMEKDENEGIINTKIKFYII